jgi:hypothetical protein
MEAVRCHLGAAGAPPALATSAQAVSLRQVLEGKLTDPRKPRGIRHSLASLVSVLVAGVACGYASILAIAVAAAGWDPEVLAAHGSAATRRPVSMSRRPRPRWAGCRPGWTPVSWRPACRGGSRPPR